MPDPTDNAVVVFREITRENVRAVCELKVSPYQNRFVAPNAVSIAQAYAHAEAWVRALYAGDVPVGLVMLEDWTGVAGAPQPLYRGERYVGLWRFMLDVRFQARGLGSASMALVIDEARARSAPQLILSFVPGPGCPEAFYRRFGFETTGDEDDGERVMRLALD